MSYSKDVDEERTGRSTPDIRHRRAGKRARTLPDGEGLYRSQSRRQPLKPRTFYLPLVLLIMAALSGINSASALALEGVWPIPFLRYPNGTKDGPGTTSTGNTSSAIWRPPAKIVGGTQVPSVTSYPFMAALALDNGLACGGTLIAPNVSVVELIG
jgi:hypothetical protein